MTRHKSGHGQGNLTEVKPGKWEVSIWATAPTGNRKRLRKTVTGTKTEARRVMTTIKAEFEAGNVVTVNRRATVAALLDAYVRERADHDLRDRTLLLERQYIDRYVIPKAGAWVVEQVRPEDLRDLLAGLQAGKAGDARPMLNTARKVHGILRRAFAYAVENSGLTVNPAAAVRRPAARRAGRVVEAGDEGPAAYTRVQASRLAAYLKRPEVEGKAFAAAIEFALLTGMRRGEVFGLKWQDVAGLEEYGTVSVTIRRTLSTGGQKRYENAPKTEAGRRTINLSPDTAQALRRHRSRQATEATAPGAYAFGTKAGGPSSPDNVLRALRAFSEAAGVPYLPFHGLRHTWATLALEQGQTPAVVSAYLGHDMAVTLSTYAHLFRSSVPAIELMPAPEVI